MEKVSEINSKNGTRSGVYENPMLHIEITNLVIFYQKLYQFYLEHMSAVLFFFVALCII